MLGVVLELQVGQPQVAVLVGGRGRVVLLVGRGGEARGRGHAVHRYAVVQTAHGLSERNFRQVHRELALRGLDAQLRALLGLCQPDDDAVGDDGRLSLAPAAEQADGARGRAPGGAIDGGVLSFKAPAVDRTDLAAIHTDRTVPCRLAALSVKPKTTRTPIVWAAAGTTRTSSNSTSGMDQFYAKTGTEYSSQLQKSHPAP